MTNPTSDYGSGTAKGEAGGLQLDGEEPTDVLQLYLPAQPRPTDPVYRAVVETALMDGNTQG